jgi:5-methylcytosine-specific restriction endonuclease McrA
MARIPDLPTVRDRIAWSYALLARAHAALDDGASRYRQIHHVIRARTFKGLRTGAMTMRSIWDDERIRLLAPHACAYCGATDALAVDHLVPRSRGGSDGGENLLIACRPCNSRKGARDLLAWMESEGRFPSVFVLRRWLKLCAAACDRAGVLDQPVTAATTTVPFDLDRLPVTFPPLGSLRLHAAPISGCAT